MSLTQRAVLGPPAVFSEEDFRDEEQPGSTITLTAPYAVTFGEGLLVGSIFGVAAGTAAPDGSQRPTRPANLDQPAVPARALWQAQKVLSENPAGSVLREPKTIARSTLALVSGCSRSFERSFEKYGDLAD